MALPQTRWLRSPPGKQPTQLDPRTRAPAQCPSAPSRACTESVQCMAKNCFSFERGVTIATSCEWDLEVLPVCDGMVRVAVHSNPVHLPKCLSSRRWQGGGVVKRYLCDPRVGVPIAEGRVVVARRKQKQMRPVHHVHCQSEWIEGV